MFLSKATKRMVHSNKFLHFSYQFKISINDKEEKVIPPTPKYCTYFLSDISNRHTINSKLSFKCFVYSNFHAALHQLVNYILFIETLCACVRACVWHTSCFSCLFTLLIFTLLNLCGQLFASTTVHEAD